MRLFAVAFVCLSVLAPSSAFAATNEVEATSSASSRMARRAGIYAGILGDPFPTLLGVNLAYNAMDFLRATVGLGRISASIGTASSSATTIGGGAKLFVPGWNLSPTAGLGFSYVSVSNEGPMSVSVGNFTSSGAHVYASVGVDWQAASGFNLGAGYNLSFRSGVGGSPYVNVGWYFDLL